MNNPPAIPLAHWDEKTQQYELDKPMNPIYCKCDETNGDNPDCPIHGWKEAWTAETVRILISDAPIGDAPEVIAKAHNAVLKAGGG